MVTIIENLLLMEDLPLIFELSIYSFFMLLVIVSFELPSVSIVKVVG